MATQRGVPRGGVNGRGGRGGRGGGNNPRGGRAGALPLAAQMRQVQRLDEPKEMAMFRRFRDLSLQRVRSVYTPSGLVDQDLLVLADDITQDWGDVSSLKGTLEGKFAVLSLLEAEDALSNLHAAQQRQRAVDRAPARLHKTGSWSQFTAQEREKLLLSNAEFSRRYPNSLLDGGVPLGVTGARVASPPPVTVNSAGKGKERA
jgi:hypothetical protein